MTFAFPPTLMQITLFSFTFAAIMDSHLDNGLLSWMNVKLPGMEAIGGLWRSDFLMCECWIQLQHVGSLLENPVLCPTRFGLMNGYSLFKQQRAF